MCYRTSVCAEVCLSHSFRVLGLNCRGCERMKEMGRLFLSGGVYLSPTQTFTQSPGLGALPCENGIPLLPTNFSLMGFISLPPSPSQGAHSANSELWCKVGGDKPSPLPLLSPTPASLPVACPPL